MWFKSSFTIPAVVAISFCLIGVTVPVAADILHVPGDFHTIQTAIDAAMDSDEVEVHPGTYNENINFLGKAIRIYSTDGPDVTIIDSQQGGTAVVTCDSSEGPDSVLEGFTITGGNSNSTGGGMHNFFSSPTVIDCTFSGNTSKWAGGMFNPAGSPTVTNCRFIQNTSGFFGGGMTNGGNTTVINCTFSGNLSFNGGGMANLSDSSPLVINCTFSGNTASNSGGGMLNADSSPTITNCTFSENTTFTENAGGIYNSGRSFPIVNNSIFWSNVGGEIVDSKGSVAIVRYSDVQGGYVGKGNIDIDPMFVDPDNDDYRLSSDSPCIDAADNTAVPMGIDADLDGNPRFVDDPNTKDTGFGNPPIVDMGAYEYQATICPWDLHGDGYVGYGDLLILLGWWCCDPNGPPDFNGDGIVSTIDLLELLANWGPCP